jgi:hypothetical protein
MMSNLTPRSCSQTTLDLPIGKWANGTVSFRSPGGGCPTASSVERGVYDATALEFSVAYAKKDIEAYKRPFVHVRLKDYLH